MIGTALANIFDALDFQGDQGLVTVDTPDVGHGRAYVWQEISEQAPVGCRIFPRERASRVLQGTANR